jgi:prepilin-type N-terminal cleavage/methylation domain-containing protein
MHMNFSKYKQRIANRANNGFNENQGFTILETLVAISILVLALTAPLAIVAQALRSSYYARDQVTAYFLAQEAVEFLRNKRDYAGLQSSLAAESWTDLFNDADGDSLINIPPSTTAKAYLVRSGGDYVLERCPTDCPEVSYDTVPDAPVLYGSDSVTNLSIFTREIIISQPVPATLSVDDSILESDPDNPPGLRELVVNVRVRWRMPDGQLSDGVTIREHLTNWQLEKTTI